MIIVFLPDRTLFKSSVVTWPCRMLHKIKECKSCKTPQPWSPSCYGYAGQWIYNSCTKRLTLQYKCLVFRGWKTTEAFTSAWAASPPVDKAAVWTGCFKRTDLKLNCPLNWRQSFSEIIVSILKAMQAEIEFSILESFCSNLKNLLFEYVDVFFSSWRLTSSESRFTGGSLVAGLTDALTGGALEHRDPVMPAGSTATGVELLQILIPAPLQVCQSRTYMVGGRAEAHQLIDRHGLGNRWSHQHKSTKAVWGHPSETEQQFPSIFSFV